jgi:hypothetical protein
MPCWYNTVLAARSTDSGADFSKAAQPVVASAPFAQDVEQGRHRGFFNPSNIVSDGRFFYFLASTTGWTGQDNGVCLFRTANPDDPTSWRAYDGTAFTLRFVDPYRNPRSTEPRPCMPLKPFPAPVGSVVRQREAGAWLAVFQASKNTEDFSVSGFYTAASRDLVHWSAPRLLIAGSTNYDDPCRSGGRMIAYPSMMDPQARGRNFDDVGPEADLFFASLAVEGCVITGNRILMRQPVAIRIEP